MNWRNSEVLEQSLVSPGLGRTPHAHRNAAEVPGASDLAQDVFAGVLGQVQVHQDQVWNGRIRIGPLPADESEGFAAAQQVNQFKSEILLLQRPIEKEDVRGVVFNDKDSGCGNNRSVFQAHSQRPASSPSSHLVRCQRYAATPAWPLRSTAWAPARRSRKGNRSPASARSRPTARVPLHRPAPPPLATRLRS